MPNFSKLLKICLVYDMEIFKILGLIFICAIICVILKQYKPEYSLVIAIVCCVTVLTLLIKEILTPITLIEEKIEQSGIDNSYFKVALKALGIGYITSFVADSCRDAGQSALALKAELAGKCAIFILSVPLVFSILETALGFAK